VNHQDQHNTNNTHP